MGLGGVDVPVLAADAPPVVDSREVDSRELEGVVPQVAALGVAAVQRQPVPDEVAGR